MTFQGKKCLVTGGSGLIGRAVVDKLVEAGAIVTSVSLDGLTPNPSVEYELADLRNMETATRVVTGKDFVFHLAGIKGSVEVTKTRPATFFVPYLQFNTNLLHACQLAETPSVVYTSSIGAYAAADIFVEDVGDDGAPMDQYPGWAKRMAELQIKSYREEFGSKAFTILRPCNVYGPGDNFDPANAMVIPSLMHKMLHRDNASDILEIWGDGTAVRDYCYSEDAADAILLAAAIQPQTSYINIGQGNGVSVQELVATLAEIQPFFYAFNNKSGGYPKRVMNIERAKSLLGWEPKHSLKEGLEKTWLWYLEHRDEYKQRQNYFVKKEGI